MALSRATSEDRTQTAEAHKRLIRGLLRRCLRINCSLRPGRPCLWALQLCNIAVVGATEGRLQSAKYVQGKVPRKQQVSNTDTVLPSSATELLIWTARHLLVNIYGTRNHEEEGVWDWQYHSMHMYSSPAEPLSHPTLLAKREQRMPDVVALPVYSPFKHPGS